MELSMILSWQLFKGKDGITMANRVFFTADHHFCHAGIIIHCRRPYSNTWEMDESMIGLWNSIVGRNDTIYHLGDFAWRNLQRAEEILRRLNGRKYLCLGSHDKDILKLARYFEEIRESFLINVSNTQQVFLNHYLHKIWPKSHYGSWHLFGHSHGRMDNYASTEGKLLDVGVDSHFFYPWSLEEVTKVMGDKPLNFNDLRRRKTKRSK